MYRISQLFCQDKNDGPLTMRLRRRNPEARLRASLLTIHWMRSVNGQARTLPTGTLTISREPFRRCAWTGYYQHASFCPRRPAEIGLDAGIAVNEERSGWAYLPKRALGPGIGAGCGRLAQHPPPVGAEYNGTATGAAPARMLQEARIAVRRAIRTKRMFPCAFFKIHSFALELVSKPLMRLKCAISRAA